MDLFTAIAEDISVDLDLKDSVLELCEFVRGLTPRDLKVVTTLQKDRDFEAWDTAARGMQTFAYQQGLKESWWEIVSWVKTEQKGEFWHAGWSSAFDCAETILIKPWVGKTFSSKDYELLVGPLKAVGFKS